MTFGITTKTEVYQTSAPFYTEGRSNGTASWVTAEVTPFGKSTITSACRKGSQLRGLRGSTSDIGGEMVLERTETFRAGRTASPPSNGKVRRYCYGFQVGFTPTFNATYASGDDLEEYGAYAVSQTIPTNPVASMAVALGELKREGLPSIPGKQLRDTTDLLRRRAGSEYLNVEFGWLPLVRDLGQFLTAVKFSRAIIDQYVKDSNRKIRRRHTGFTVRDTRITEGGGFILPTIASIAATGHVSEQLSTKFWFSGAFRYHVPVDSGFMNRLLRYEALANKLFGTRITPEVVWNLAPWSWAVDWFTNAGDVIHNISALGSDGLVMQYGYAMREQRTTASYVQRVNPNEQSYIANRSAYMTVNKTMKQRVRANPYGFGISDLDLSKRQLAILAALGLTQGKRDR